MATDIGIWPFDARMTAAEVRDNLAMLIANIHSDVARLFFMFNAWATPYGEPYDTPLDDEQTALNFKWIRDNLDAGLKKLPSCTRCPKTWLYIHRCNKLMDAVNHHSDVHELENEDITVAISKDEIAYYRELVLKTDPLQLIEEIVAAPESEFEKKPENTAYDRDLWLFEQYRNNVPLDQIVRDLKGKTELGWGLISTTQGILDAVQRFCSRYHRDMPEPRQRGPKRGSKANGKKVR